MKNVLCFLLLFVCVALRAQLTVSGTLTDKETGEQLLYASIYDEETGAGAVTNEYGFFSFTLPGDSATLTLDFIGYATRRIKVNKDNVGSLDFSMSKEATDIGVVEIKVARTPQEEIHNSTQMSAIKIPIKDIKYIPSIGGESDVIKC